MATASNIAGNPGWSSGYGSEELPALGFLELSSISRGLYLTDVILKKAPVHVIASQPVSSGKHVVLYFGGVASVEESHRAALDEASGCVLKEILIPSVHAKLVPYLDSLWEGRSRPPTCRFAGCVSARESAARHTSSWRVPRRASRPRSRRRTGA